MINQINVCTNLRFLRKKLGLNQTEMAQKLDVSQSYYGNIEAGNKNITYEMIGKIAELYHISPNWLLLGAGEMYIEPPKQENEPTPALPADWEAFMEKKINEAVEAKFQKMNT